MEDMRSLRRMGLVNAAMMADLERAYTELQKGDELAIQKRLKAVDGMPTQECKAKPVPRHMRQPLAKNKKKRDRKHGVGAL